MRWKRASKQLWNCKAKKKRTIFTRQRYYSNGIVDMPAYRNFSFEKIIIPDSVEIITGSAFKNMIIRNLIIASSVKNIQEYSICNIRELTYLYLPRRLSGQLQLALAETCKLTELSIPEAATGAGYTVYLEFYWRDLNVALPLKRIAFGNGIARINVQGDMRKVESVTFPASLQYLTGRMLLGSTTQFNFQSRPTFEHQSFYGLTGNKETLQLFIASNIPLAGKKAVRDFWDSMGYKNMYPSQDLY